MATLKADNRILIRNTKYTLLSANILSGVTALPVISTSSIVADDYILVEDFGNETAEILKVNTISGNGTINTTSATVFAHSESSKITKLSYNQARFYRTTTTTFSAGSSLGTVEIDAQSFYTVYNDTTNSTGYGWFIFLNETTSANSAPSNPIPYVDFDPNSVKKIIDRFLSSSNNKEMKNISFEDAFDWLNEAYSVAYNELNLANQEYTTPSVYSMSFTSGTQEASLPDNFSELISITDSDGTDIDYIGQRDISYIKENGSSSNPAYYLRGGYMGIVPVVTADTTYYIYYNAKSGTLSSYYDNVELPDNNYYCLSDYMTYKAAPRLGMSIAEGRAYLDSFNNSINRMKVTSNKQNSNSDQWGIADSANV
jgi:hypothetical protein